jgi:hypothetical protein
MLPQYFFLSLIAACSAVPLNINLGAYSPALVVGDGEISLGSTESASELMATLASGAAANEAGAEAQQQGQQEDEQQQQEAAPPQEQEQPQQEGGGEGEGGEQQQEGDQQQQEPPAEENAAKRAPNLVRTLEHFGKRSPAVDEHLAAVESAMEWIKRDLEGFNAALSYAREAMQNTPKIELGTENAGVGMIVNAGLNVPANSAANGAPAAERKAKKSEVVAEESEAPKMTLVAITEV